MGGIHSCPVLAMRLLTAVLKHSQYDVGRRWCWCRRWEWGEVRGCSEQWISDVHEHSCRPVSSHCRVTRSAQRDTARQPDQHDRWTALWRGQRLSTTHARCWWRCHGVMYYGAVHWLGSTLDDLFSVVFFSVVIVTPVCMFRALSSRLLVVVW